MVAPAQDTDSGPSKAPSGPLPQPVPPQTSTGPDWASYYGGLDGLDSRLAPAKAQALKLLDSDPNPKEARARAINQAYLSVQMPNVPRGTIQQNWQTVKDTYAKTALGIDQKGMTDSALYGKIAERFKPAEHGHPAVGGGGFWQALRGIGPGTAVNLAFGATSMKELPEAPRDLPNITIPGIGNPAVIGATYNALRPFVAQMATPAMIPMAGGSELLGLAREYPAAKAALVAMSGGLSALMGPQAIASVKAAKETMEDPKASFQDKVQAGVDTFTKAAMTVIPALHAAEAVVPGVLAQMKGKPLAEAPEIIKDAVAKAEDLSPEKEQAALNAAQQIESIAKAGHPDAPPAPETTPTSPNDPEKPDYGIAARVTEQRARAGQIEPVEPGEGIAPPASVEKGRALLADGANPDQILTDFNKTNRFSSDDVAVLRAQGEQLAQKASEAAEKFGPDSEEYKTARDADSKWRASIQPVLTEWAKAGSAMQGSTDIDTGDFHSLATAFKNISGREFTPDEAKQAQDIADGVKGASHDAEEAKNEVFGEIKKKIPAGKQPEPGSVADVWKRAKDYLESGEDDFDDIRHKIAADTGLPVSDVTKKLAGPKKIRVMTNEMYSKMAQRRELIAQANHWLKQQAMPGWQRFASAIPRAFFGAKVFGHGTVGMITHAGINMFDPTEWATYWPNFFKQYKLIGWHDQGAFHERAMQDLTRDRNFTTARRAGLANNPKVAMDDYQKGFLGKLGLTGNRGFDALKIYRQARFNQTWDALTPDMRTPEMAKLLADDVNHSTGYVRASFPQAASTAFFAPKLEASRWAFLMGDPIRDAKTFAGWDKATPEQQHTAISNVKRRAIIAGTYLTLLGANQGLLTASDSKEKINFSNPKKPDFLSFKGFGHQLGIISPTIGLFRYLSNMLHASIEQRTGSELKDSRAEEMGNLTTKYLRAKLSPFGSVVADVASQADYQGRPLPFSGDKTPSYLKKEGVGPYTYGEYISEHVAPIPVEDAVREVWHNLGMSEKRSNDWMAALVTFAIVGGTGARVQKDTDLEDQKKPASKPTKEKKKLPDRELKSTYR